MINLIMHGCNGAMGRVISAMAQEMNGIRIAAGVDLNTEKNYDYPVYASLGECTEAADAVVDFASAKAVDELLDYCLEKELPLVLCTTGLTEEQLKRAEDASKRIPVLRSANMSLGVNLLLKLIQDAAKVLGNAGFDMEIVEKHHNQKKDAPSGTALAMAEAVNEAMGGLYHFVTDRSSIHEKRDGKEIGISSVRGGSIVGEHDMIYAGKDEVITISHTAYSKAIFAKGALEAAKFLAGKQPGLYTMTDVIGL